MPCTFLYINSAQGQEGRSSARTLFFACSKSIPRLPYPYLRTLEGRKKFSGATSFGQARAWTVDSSSQVILEHDASPDHIWYSKCYPHTALTLNGLTIQKKDPGLLFALHQNKGKNLHVQHCPYSKTLIIKSEIVHTMTTHFLQHPSLVWNKKDSSFSQNR